MNIVFIGFRATGKSTIAKELGVRLGKIVISTDSFIEQASGMTIEKIVKKYGWEKFRKVESALIRDISAMDDRIIDMGGGVVDLKENLDIIRQNNIVVWLDADIKDIKKRMKKKDRPSVTGKGSIEEADELYARRKPLYKTIASVRIDTSKLSIKDTTDKIIAFLNE